MGGGHYCVLDDETFAFQVNRFDLATACLPDSPTYKFSIKGDELTLKSTDERVNIGFQGTYQRLSAKPDRTTPR